MVNTAVAQKLILLLSLAICLALVPSFARAHEGLHEQIVAITAKIKRDPKNASLYLQRGELYRLHRDWTRAAADYDRASRLQPNLTIVDLARGKMLFESRPFPASKVCVGSLSSSAARPCRGTDHSWRVFLPKLELVSRQRRISQKLLH